MIDLESICKNAIDLSLDVGKFIRNEKDNIKRNDIKYKGFNDFVTYVDKKSEELLVEGLKKIFPEAGFITEEETAGLQGEQYRWIIDPLDGTTNFIHGLAPFSISIGLYRERKPLAGVVYEICANECFYAWEGSKAYMNGEEISTSSTEKLKDSLIITGFPYTHFDELSKILKSVEYFLKNSHGLRRLGSAAADLAYVACGRSDGFYEVGLHPWDVAAGVFILQQAGGVISDFSGGPDFIFGKQIVASNKSIFREFQEAVNKLLVVK
jgi:myo-inositol-1(or 4)-monophosphatase